jgi:glutathione S-transferase
MATVELYHFWSSVCSVRCRMALEEKGVAWVSRYIDLFAFDQLRPEYLAINPKGVVPTLVHNGRPIRESSVINEYIDAAFAGPKLTPSDPLEAARMREFVHACDEGFSAIVKLTMVRYILPKLRNRWGDAELRRQAERRPMRFYQDIHGRAVRGEIAEAELADARATIEDLLDLLERTLAPGPWIVGEQFSLAEISIAPYMFRLGALAADQFWAADRRPLVADWYRRLSERPAFQTAVSWPDESGGGYEEVGLTTER